ncbi:MAG: leucine-rich repeat protein, partial [Oscillospiraceae bacterium]|nr:leucine-rich repeat protein [Oscillospiraceae bacterium]
MKGFFKKALSAVTAAALALSLTSGIPIRLPVDLGVTASAEETTSTCTCETKCAEGSVNSDCAVCSAEGADLTACAGTDTAADTTYPYAVVDTAAGTATIDGTLGGKTTATEDDITALVEQLKAYVDSGNTTITVTGSEPAMITVDNISMTAIGEAIARLSGYGTHSADNPYNGKIDLILPNVTEIVDYEFQNAHALNSINLPKVTTIGVEGFNNCWYLQKLTFGSVVTSIKDGIENAFQSAGASVDGGYCDLVLSCGQAFAATEYQPDPYSSRMWWGRTWKSITLAHSGGEATCTTKAFCAVCNLDYGEVDPDNHTGTLGTYAPTADGSQHAATWNCCNTVETADHTAEPTYTPNTDDSTKHNVTYSCCGTFTEVHSGGTATCQKQAVCVLCGTSYGELNADNHESEEFTYTANADGTTHTKKYKCCGTVVDADEAHTPTYSANGNTITVSCSANCGYSGTAAISATGKTYDGAAVEATVTKTGILENKTIAITYAVKDGATLESAPANAGTYTASITLGDKTVSVEFTINGVDPTYTAPTAETGLTYNGSAQELISAGTATGGTMQYSLDNATYSTAIPTGTNAGTYTVYYKVVGDENYSDTESA